MRKCLAIQALLDRLDLPGHGWGAVDHWEADDCAVGIAHEGAPRRLVYVSMFEKRADRYAFECEVPAGPDETDYDVIESAEDVTYNDLQRVIEAHLGVP